MKAVPIPQRLECIRFTDARDVDLSDLEVVQDGGLDVFVFDE